MRNVDAVCATLRTAIEAPSGTLAADILIDCTAASEIDLTFVQLLIAARVSAHQRNQSVSLVTAASGHLLNTLTRGGFQAVDHGSVRHPAFWFEPAHA